LGVTGVATLGNGAILGIPASGTVTNLTGTASININGTVGATTASTGAFTTLSATGLATLTGGASYGSNTTWASDNTFNIGAVGANRPANIYVGSAGVFGTTLTVGTTLSMGQGITFVSDNTYNIGSVSSNRPANIYVGTSGVFGGSVSGGTSGTGYSFSGSAPATSLTLDASGFLAIGPDSGKTTNSLLWTANTGGRLYVGKESSAGGTIINGTAAYAGVIATNNTSSLQFGTNNATHITLDTSGNLGIANTSPSSFNTFNPKLVVGSGSGGQSITVYSGTASVGDITFADGTSATQQYMGVLRYDHADNAMKFYTNGGGLGMTLDVSGNLLVGVATANANGGVLQLKSGITFPATAVAATDANTLDDYEEGTWTPALAGTSAVTYSNQEGRYTKVGRLVTITMIIQPATVTYVSSTAQLKITGLPFTPVAMSYDSANSWGAVSAQNLAYSGSGNDQNTTATSAVAYVNSTPELKAGAIGQSTKGVVNNSAFTNSSVFETTITYFV